MEVYSGNMLRNRWRQPSIWRSPSWKSILAVRCCCLFLTAMETPVENRSHTSSHL